MSKPGAGSDLWQLWRAWALQPLQIGAISPSGEALAALMTGEIGPESAPVLEIGPGTGVFTRALLARGVDEAALTLVEMQPEFAALLRQRFPRARVVQGNAARLSEAQLASSEPFGAVLSGLPLLSMRPRTVMAILKTAFAHAAPEAGFYQFTYGPVCPVPRSMLERLGLQAQRIGGTLRNIPPAGVYRIGRQGEAEA